LSGSLIEAGIELQRLKTGTPPRILGRSIDFTHLAEQRSDAEPTLFAFHDTRDEGDLFHVEHTGETRLGWKPGSHQMSCWMTHTTGQSAQIVRDNLHLSAMYSGEIVGVGPRYCPSIEDKFVRFADKPRHMLYLEPEGRSTNEYYINGLSTSLPFDVQVRLVHSIPGLEQAVLLRPAYAVEYDYAQPTQLFPSLESRKMKHLFFAGQINGTSGYEEAAAQGLVAGINAVLKVRGEDPLIIKRHEGYIGVLIDDLVTKGTTEPYRMFTSRAEYRLLFNHGSAELRMLEHATNHKLLSDKRLGKVKAKLDKILRWTESFEKLRTPLGLLGDVVRRDKDQTTLPPEFLSESKEVRDEVLYRVTYRGYLTRELRLIEKLKDAEVIRLPESIDYLTVPGLRRESALKLQQFRPYTIGQAGRISGVNPADLSILMVLVRSRQKTPPNES
jgi:tRNA uridine 5-carboxymethylaminomethyl modification enzyme